MRYIFWLCARVSLWLCNNVFNQENHLYWDNKFWYWTSKLLETHHVKET